MHRPDYHHHLSPGCPGWWSLIMAELSRFRVWPLRNMGGVCLHPSPISLPGNLFLPFLKILFGIASDASEFFLLIGAEAESESDFRDLFFDELCESTVSRISLKIIWTWFLNSNSSLILLLVFVPQCPFLVFSFSNNLVILVLCFFCNAFFHSPYNHPNTVSPISAQNPARCDACSCFLTLTCARLIHLTSSRPVHLLIQSVENLLNEWFNP